jgi:hypothetical protein
MISADAKIPIFALTRKAKTAPSVCIEIIKKNICTFAWKKMLVMGGRTGNAIHINTLSRPVPPVSRRGPLFIFVIQCVFSSCWGVKSCACPACPACPALFSSFWKKEKREYV